MKFLAAIMALIVLTLSVQPAFAKSEVREEIGCASHCCSSDNEAEAPATEEEQGADPCTDFCNPFLKCGACASSTMEFLNFAIQQPTQALSIYIISTQSVYSQFEPEFWQPPKLA